MKTILRLSYDIYIGLTTNIQKCSHIINPTQHSIYQTMPVQRSISTFNSMEDSITSNIFVLQKRFHLALNIRLIFNYYGLTSCSLVCNMIKPKRTKKKAAEEYRLMVSN